MRVNLLLVLLVLLLAGCQTSGGEVSSQPEPIPQPKTAQELLEEQPIDDNHTAFLVDTGGRLGTLLVTAELGEQREENEFEFPMTLSVWNPTDMSQPIQTQDWMTLCFGDNQVVDVNFDGYSDFICLYARGVQAEIFQCMRWDEEQGLFVEEPEFATISSPGIDSETQTIYGWNRESAAGDGVTTFHQWEDGELICIRRIEVFQKDWRDDDSPMEVTVKDRINGELCEVYRAEFPMDTLDYFDERFKWEHLDYHGETE